MKKKNTGLLSIVLLLLNLSVSAQTVKIYGRITNQKTGKILPFVNIQLKNSGYGTVSDNNGYFNLKVPSKYKNHFVIFSYMGYESQEKVLTKVNNSFKISLNPADTDLEEVIIMPDSTLLDLLRAAYKKIPENYSTKPTKLKGFYRETKQTPEQYLYFAEAVTETYKTGYQKGKNKGQVKIIKSMVNEFPGADTLNNVKFYGGIFSGNTGDFVYSKYSFIDPKKFSAYKYSIIGTTIYQNNPVYIIYFDTKNDTLKGFYKGKLYIEKSNLAYVACEYEHTKRGITRNNNQNPISAFYVKYNERWHLKYEQWTSNSINNKFNSKIIENSEFITTEIFTDSVKLIPYEERIDYGDIFSDEAKKYYDENYWEEYNVLEHDTLLKKQLTTIYTTDESKELLTKKYILKPLKKQNLLFKIISRLNSGIAINYLPLS